MRLHEALLFHLFCGALVFLLVEASQGDRCRPYQYCLGACQHNCTNGSFDKKQSSFMMFLSWNCLEECKYTCMWKTVEQYQSSGMRVPQFHGKWPFIRMLGMQEPASVLFSILNGVTNLIGYIKYRVAVPSDAPLYIVTAMQTLIAVNAWLWSSVFHTRDFPWTEKLDYFCATSLVLHSFYVLIHRLSYEAKSENVKRIRWLAANIITAFYLGHISYLSFQKFDYGYNMQANVTIGIINSITWLSFCFRKRKTHCHVRKMAAAVLLTNFFLLFELSDFPPFLWILDAHSIWHLLTIPMPLLVYSFFKDESLKMLQDLEKNKVP